MNSGIRFKLYNVKKTTKFIPVNTNLAKPI